MTDVAVDAVQHQHQQIATSTDELPDPSSLRPNGKITEEEKGAEIPQSSSNIKSNGKNEKGSDGDGNSDALSISADAGAGGDENDAKEREGGNNAIVAAPGAAPASDAAASSTTGGYGKEQNPPSTKAGRAQKVDTTAPDKTSKQHSNQRNAKGGSTNTCKAEQNNSSGALFNNLLPKTQRPTGIGTRGRIVSLDRRDCLLRMDSEHDIESVYSSSSPSSSSSCSYTTDEGSGSVYSSVMSGSRKKGVTTSQAGSRGQVRGGSSSNNRGKGPDSDDSSDGFESSSFTSDGESSYFSEHLPSPKSAARKSSYGSIGSGGGGNVARVINPLPPGYIRGGVSGSPGMAQRKVESDASLSFSDEDDDDIVVPTAVHHSPQAPLLPPGASASHSTPPGTTGNMRTGVKTPTELLKEQQKQLETIVQPIQQTPGNDEEEELQLFPRRITRLHSVSSLVSSSSEEDSSDPGGNGVDDRGRKKHAITTIATGPLRRGPTPPGHRRQHSHASVSSILSEASDLAAKLESEEDFKIDPGRAVGGTYDPRIANSSGLSDTDDSAAAYSSSDTSSDPSVRSELRHLASKKEGGKSSGYDNSGNRTSSVPSGRRTPVKSLMELSDADTPVSIQSDKGEAKLDSARSSSAEGGGGFLSRFFSSPNSAANAAVAKEQQHRGGHAPPHIQQGGYPTGAVIAHPQPQHHPLTPEQMAALAAAAAVGGYPYHFPYPPVPPHPMHGPFPRHPPHQASPAGTTGDGSQITLPMVYSDDEESDESESYRGPSSRGLQRGAGGGDIQGGPGNETANFYKRGAAAHHVRSGSGTMGDSGNEGSPEADGGTMTRGEQLNFQHQSSDGDGEGGNSRASGRSTPSPSRGGFKLYWQRWLMLLYMSVLNLLSDWTCYSVAPIAVLTSEAFGTIDPESLVVVFLGANAISTALEPIILSRLGLRRTIVFGALLLMLGSMVKSGGLPLIMQNQLEKGKGEWRVYLGFFLVGLSQPLYQCTPALLSASWFPEKERTMATGIALNSNQLGIGCAFAFGTLLVATSDDIPSYFGLLSLISTITFIGCAIQFDDAPPTPPSDTARIIRGTLEIRMPSFRDMIWRAAPSSADGMKRAVTQSGRDVGPPSLYKGKEVKSSSDRSTKSARGRDSKARDTSASRGSAPRRRLERSSSGSRHIDSDGSANSNNRARRSSDRKKSSSSAGGSRASSGRPGRSSTGRSSSSRHQLGRPNSEGAGSTSNSHRRRHGSSRARSASSENGFRAGPRGRAPAPSPALDCPTAQVIAEIAAIERDIEAVYPLELHALAPPPSPMMPGRVAGSNSNSERKGDEEENSSPLYEAPHRQYMYGSYGGGVVPPQTGAVTSPEQTARQEYYQHHPYGFAPLATSPQVSRGGIGGAEASDEGAVPDTPFPNLQHLSSGSLPPYGQYQGYPYYFQPPQYGYYADPGYYYHHAQYAPQFYPLPETWVSQQLPTLDTADEGAEPVVTLTPHHLEIDIKDDQILRSARACLSRPGFLHALVAFTVSGIVINTLSTYMDYLVRLNGAGRTYVGIVGGMFQVVIMMSSMIVGRQTDKSRAYYSVTIGLLVFGAFALAECGVSLDANNGGDVRWALIIVAALVGPLQPVATELGVDVVYPLSENTVLVIQQLASNLLSALFIPFFKAVRDVGTGTETDNTHERPQYTFSFYLLIVLHASATVFFATFNGRYLRYEHEMAKKAGKSQPVYIPPNTAFHPVSDGSYNLSAQQGGARAGANLGERQPLVNSNAVV